MIPEELGTLFSHLPAGTEVWFVRMRLPASSPDTDDHHAIEKGGQHDPVGDLPEEPLKVHAASHRSGIPERELRRAIQNGFLPYRLKERGRDAGAHLIIPAFLEEYRQRRARIRNGAEARPENWPDPVGSRHEY